MASPGEVPVVHFEKQQKKQVRGAKKNIETVTKLYD